MHRVAIASIVLAVGTAHADPAIGHVITAPTAWVPTSGTVVASGGIDHRGDGDLSAGLGFGGLAVVEIGRDSDVRACLAPPCGTDNRAEPFRLDRASFKLGAHQDAWFRGQPALAFGVRTAFSGLALEGFSNPKVVDAYVVASREISRLKLHAGAEAIDASFRDDTGEHRLGTKLRPLGAVEITPPQYPKTTLMGDIAWVPRFEHAGPTLEWLGGVSVRYQALRWGSIELAFRHREAEGLAASTVLVRVNGVWEH